MLTISQLSKSFGPTFLFEDISMRLQRGERVGLVGPNGAGKTTLFDIILGATEPDAGKVELERDAQIGFLAQESAPSGDATILELTVGIDAEFRALYRIFRETSDPDAPEHLEASERFQERDGYSLEARAKRILSGLAFQPDDFDKPARTLSGGWIMRAHLARLLLMQPDCLMLDEPTNHLDLETLGWFQQQLRNYPGAILTISHDREFLNAICDSVAELKNGRLHRYPGNYEDFLQQKAEREEQQLAAWKNQQKEIARLQAFVNRFRAQANKASQAQSRLKQLERMERVEAPESESPTIQFQFPQPPRSGQRVVQLQNIHQAYGDHVVYRDLNLTVERHQRIVLVGPNGAGKSTLLKILANQVPIQGGHRELGHNVTAGYFSQQRAEGLNLEQSVLDEAMEHVDGSLNEEKARTLLGTFLFRGDDVFKKVKVLSGGEKSRLALVKILLHPPNLLLLDEPTTHLDMPAIDALLGALQNYSGTLLFVSHDVHFIRALADRTLLIQDGKLTHYAGDYDYYLRKSEAGSAQSGLVAAAPEARDKAAPGKGKTPGLNAKEQRRRRAEQRQAAAKERKAIEKRVAELEKEILELEEAQKQVSRELEASASYTDPEAAKELNQRASRITKRLAERNQAWEQAAEQLMQSV